MLLADGAVIVAATDRTYALDVANGTPRWEFAAPVDSGVAAQSGHVPVPGQVVFKRLATNGHLVFVPAWGASVSAVDARSGAVRWSWLPGRTADLLAPLPFRGGAEGVALSGDTVYVNVWKSLNASGAASEMWLVALDARTGAELWRHVTPATGGIPVRSAPTVAGALVVQKMSGGAARAFDRFSGVLRWTHDPRAESSTISAAVHHEGMLYMDSGRGYVIAVRASDGVMQWETPVGQYASAPLVVSHDYVYAPAGQRLHVLDRRTGRAVRTLYQPGEVSNSAFRSAATIADGKVYISIGGGFWCFIEP